MMNIRPNFASAQAAADRPAPRSGRALAVSWPVGGFVWGRAIAYVGFWSFSLVSAVAVYQRTSSLAAVGLVSVAQFVPQFILTPLSGVLADRGHVATQIVLGFVLTGLGPALLGAWILAAGSVESLPGAWPILLASLIVGVGFAVGSSSTAAVLPTLVAPDELAAAVALNSVPLMLARAVGPAVGGFLASLAGLGVSCLVSAALNVGCAVLLASMRLPQRFGADLDGSTALGRAVTHVWRDRRLLMVLLGVGAVGFAAEPSITLAPAMAERFGDASKAGWVASAFGLGGVVGLFLLGPLRRRFRHETGAGLGLLMMGSALFCGAFGRAPVVTLGVMAFAGVGMTAAHANLATLVQAMSPQAMRGRITALWFLCWLGARPVGAMAGGSAGDLMGITWVLALAGLTVLGVAAACLVVWVRSPARSRPSLPKDA